MAKQTIIIDDIDGSSDARTVSLSIDNGVWVIDLGAKNRALLEEALAPFLAHARRVDGRRRGSYGAGARSADQSHVRAWAAANGFDVSTRGRLPKAVIEAYQAAQG